VRGREYLEYIKGIVLMHNLKGYFGDSKVFVSIRMFPKSKRRFDCDNFTKCLFDSFSKCGIWQDDDQVYELHIIKKKPMKNGFLEVHIHTINGNE
jgi:Holliday junction resolvase RusA-like endonuclease